MRVVETLRPIMLVCAVFVLSACGSDPSSTYTIVGEYIAVVPEGLQQAGSPTNRSIDYSNSIITLYRTQIDEDGQVERVALASKPFRDGLVVFEGKLDAPESIEIAANSSETAEPLTIVASVGPGAELTFALLDYWYTFPEDKLALKGKSLLFHDSASKFTISGNVDTELRGSGVITMELETSKWTSRGHQEFVELGLLMLDDGKFVYEDEISEPVVAEIEFRGDNFVVWTQAVIEPGAHISIQPRTTGAQSIATMPSGWFSMDQTSTGDERGPLTMFATAESGRHTRLIDSWQRSHTFLFTVDAYNVAYEDFLAQQGSMVDQSLDRASTESPDLDEDRSDASNPSESTVYIAAQECKHIDLSGAESPSSFGPPPNLTPPPHFKLSREIWEIRRNALDQIARHGLDPMDSLLALELGALTPPIFEEGSESILEDKIKIYDNLASNLSEDIVARRIGPARKEVESILQAHRNDRLLLPGQKAPPITVATLKKQEIAIYDVFSQNDIIYLQFWDPPYGSWNFARLRELYDAYSDLGLQIVTISLEPNWTDWDTASEQQDIPWLNLGDLSEDAPIGAVAVAYGRLRMNKNYLIDNKGCILRKDLHVDQLTRFLVEEYGEVATTN